LVVVGRLKSNLRLFAIAARRDGHGLPATI